MSSNRYHKRSDYGTKSKREHNKKVDKDSKVEPRHKSYESKSREVPEHELARKYNVTWHAVKRYAERILDINIHTLNSQKIIMIAKAIRESVPEHMLSETRYNIFDDYYAVVNNGMIVTIVKVGKDECKEVI